MMNRRYQRIVLRLAIMLVATIAIFGLTLRALDATYGEPRCSQVDITIVDGAPAAWQPVGWRVADGYDPLYCPSMGRWWHLQEDGSVSPA
jgi:hypothetical protein